MDRPPGNVFLTDKDRDRSKQLLAAHMATARERLAGFLDTHGTSLPVLGVAMEEFTKSVFKMPEGTACKSGCSYCCHLRLGASIPEVLVVYKELAAQATPEGLSLIKQRILDTCTKGNVLDEGFWLTTRTPCPFLDDKGLCLIYALRPFSCRAYHSTDSKVCKTGFEKGVETLIPCFNLYRASTDMYSSIFIKVLEDRGFASFQIGFVRALAILFADPGAVDGWLNKEDVFAKARL